ncbi:MAG TPA: type VI secretion system-associated FHA domain protein TagH [Micropepsaceae bacterium]|jgi:type VI secretion system FHA domain protein
MNLILTIVQGPPGGAAATRSFDDAALGKRGITLGRRPDNDWALPNDTGVSREHCRIVHDEDGFALIDNSSFGSIVNDRRLGRGEHAQLREGDRITLGEYVFVVSLEGEEPPFSGQTRMVESPQPAFPELDLENDPLGPFDPAAASPFSDPFQQKTLPEDVTYPDDLPAGKEAFALPKRILLPDDADILGDLRPAVEAARPAAPQADGLSEFLKGAGLNRVETGDSNAKLRIAGEAFRAAIEGICAILTARAQFKTELRVDKTQFGAARNNPLKSKSSTDDIVATMIAGRKGFMPAPDAMHEALEDIQAHEMALIAAIQVALSQLLEQIDPERLEQRLEKRSIFDGLPGLKKARLWEVYETTYAEIAGELAEDFHGTFGKAFAEAYAKYFRGK